ncbi:sialidase family protein [Actinoallomurus sp. NPDC052274]|uniref:sialidase family protein n=1 Tax=Actinoallomurus sp. NPDC052274 TaxID=3155420 RepID=UPI00341ED510
MFASSGHGIQLATGRLVQPIVYHDAAGDHASNIYSDDHGATWHNGTTAGTGVNESKVIQRSTGRVAQNMRSNAGGNRWYATAADVTASYGTAWNSGLIDPGCNGDEISYLPAASGAPALTNVALHSNNAATGRTDLTVRLSRDDGSSWPQEALLKPGAAGYSTMAVLPDGSVADLYEIGDTGGIVFTRFTVPWLAP